MPLVEYDDVIGKFSAWRLNETFHIMILPGRRQRCDDLVDTRTLSPARNTLAVYTIAVSY